MQNRLYHWEFKDRSSSADVQMRDDVDAICLNGYTFSPSMWSNTVKFQLTDKEHHRKKSKLIFSAVLLFLKAPPNLEFGLI